MTSTLMHRVFAPLRRVLPPSLANGLRSTVTAFLTPIYFSYLSGHFLSSYRMAAVTRKFRPLPWYTYPCIDFVKSQDFTGRRILEFGGGQSTLFWSEHAASVVTFEGDASWFQSLKRKIAGNVDLHLVSLETPEKTCQEIRRVLEARAAGKFDVVIIDGLFRPEMIPIALEHLAPDGMLICDDSEGYDIFESLQGSGLMRVDFCGHQPGVLLPHSTSIYFGPQCRFTGNTRPIMVDRGGC